MKTSILAKQASLMSHRVLEKNFCVHYNFAACLYARTVTLSSGGGVLPLIEDSCVGVKPSNGLGQNRV